MSSLLQTGSIFANDYRIVQRLDGGGMGIVYVVEHIHIGGKWALKIMHPELVRDPDLRSRFAQEARTPVRIRSDHVVKVTAAGVTNEHDQPYYVMELLEGKTLAEWIDRRGPPSRVDSIQFFKQIFHAIAMAHNEKIVHRDLKPTNIFMADAQSANVSFNVKVLDFGIAKVIAEAKTAHTQVLGSPAWMAPEQTRVNGVIGPQADVWALGLIAFYVFTGRSYWLSVTRQEPYEAILRELLLDPLQWASARAMEYGCAQLLPDGFDAWFRRCVCRDPSGRFPDAGEAWHALSSVLAISLHSTRTVPLNPSLEGMNHTKARGVEPVEVPGLSTPDPTRLSLPPRPLPESPRGRRLPMGTTLMVLGMLCGIGLIAAGSLTGEQQDPWHASRQVTPRRSIPRELARPQAHATTAKVSPTAEQTELRIGYLHLAPMAGSRWTQAHEDGRSIAENDFKRDSKIRVVTHVTEASKLEAGQKLQNMIDEYHDQLIFATSVEFGQAIVEVARRNPNTQFVSCGTNISLPNVVSYFGRLYQAKYLAGILAGKQSASGHIGYIAAKPVPEVFSNINAFTMGVRKVRPSASVYVRWINEWSAPDLEKTATSELVREGSDVITMDTDSLQVVQTVNKLNQPGRKVFSIANNGQRSCEEAGSDSCLTSVYWNWGPLYSKMWRAFAGGSWVHDFVNRSPLWLELDAEPSLSLFNIKLDGISARLVEQTTVTLLAEKRSSIAKDTLRGKYEPFVDKVLMLSLNGPPKVVSLIDGHLPDASLINMCWYVDGVSDKNANRASASCRDQVTQQAIYLP